MKMKFRWMIVCALIMAITACTTTPTQSAADEAMLGTIVALNVQLTQSAATLTSVVAQQSATPEKTNTPMRTATYTPTITLTPTPLSGVWLTFDQDTNCRSGPGTYYMKVATVEAGNKLQALARSTDGNFYYVRYFDTSNHYCWVTKDTSYHTGNPNSLQVYTVEPTKTVTLTPTTEAGFLVSYSSLQSCNSEYFLNFNVTNVGYTMWQSIKIVIVDNTSKVTVTSTADTFTGYAGCGASQIQGDLTTGEVGLVSSYSPGQFTYDPTGHSLAVTVSVYSGKGNSGTVLTKSFSVTP
jgi:hypothetical protein